MLIIFFHSVLNQLIYQQYMYIVDISAIYCWYKINNKSAHIHDWNEFQLPGTEHLRRSQKEALSKYSDARTYLQCKQGFSVAGLTDNPGWLLQGLSWNTGWFAPRWNAYKSRHKLLQQINKKKLFFWTEFLPFNLPSPSIGY